MEKQTFKESGLESIAWFIQVFKKHPEKRGYSFIRNENINGYTGNYPKLTTQVEALVAGGYLQKQGKPENPRSTKYVVTSFGHRYLDQHKDETAVDGESEETPSTETTTPAAALAAANDRIIKKNAEIAENAPVEKVSDLLHRSFSPLEAPEFVPSVPETPEQRKKRLGKSYTIDRRPVEDDDDAPDDAFDDIRTPKVRAVAQAMPEPTAEAQPDDGEDDRNMQDLDDEPGVSADPKTEMVGYLKEVAGKILFDRHAAEVTVVDLIEEIEKE